MSIGKNKTKLESVVSYFAPSHQFTSGIENAGSKLLLELHETETELLCPLVSDELTLLEHWEENIPVAHLIFLSPHPKRDSFQDSPELSV